MIRSEVVGMVKMRFDVTCVKDHLRRFGIVYTVRAYDYGNYSNAIVSGIGEVTREKIGVVSSIEDIKPYTPFSGFETPEEWQEQIGRFTGGRRKWLYRVRVKEEKTEKRIEERVNAWGNPCERCKMARGCTLRPKRVAPDTRGSYVVCVDRQGRYRERPDLYDWEKPPERGEYSVYGAFFDPIEDQRNERYGEERLEYPQSRIKRWMDTAQERYREMQEIGARISQPTTEFEKCAMFLARHKTININDPRKGFNALEETLREYEKRRYRGAEKKRLFSVISEYVNPKIGVVCGYHNDHMKEIIDSRAKAWEEYYGLNAEI